MTNLADTAIGYLAAVLGRTLTWEPEKREAAEALDTVRAEIERLRAPAMADPAVALTVLLLPDGTAWRCHTTTESHPDRTPCAWCVRLPDSLVEPLSARYPERSQ